ncbi:MAG: hypothetical protein ACREPT_01610 [Rudaea sp.]
MFGIKQLRRDIVSLFTHLEQTIMNQLDNVNAGIQAQTDANTALATNVAAVSTELGVLATEIAGFKAGTVTQAQIDDIATRVTTQATATKAASDALAAATAGAVATDAGTDASTGATDGSAPPADGSAAS